MVDGRRLVVGGRGGSYVVSHDLAEEHVLEACACLTVIEIVECFVGFKQVRVAAVSARADESGRKRMKADESGRKRTKADEERGDAYAGLNSASFA